MYDINITANEVNITQDGYNISMETPTDGYALIWDVGCNQYKPKPIPQSSNGRLTTIEFLQDGYWTCPAGVTTVIVSGSSGGIGGGGGGGFMESQTPPESSTGGPGGLPGTYFTSPLNVVPGTNYPIIIGQGGLGMTGKPRGIGPDSLLFTHNLGGTTSFGNILHIKSIYGIFSPDFGYSDGYFAGAVMQNQGDGQGGFAGSNGNGGDGGLSNQPGQNASANSGAGGGGGGGCNDDSGDGAGFPGGNGGSGWVKIIY